MDSESLLGRRALRATLAAPWAGVHSSNVHFIAPMRAAHVDHHAVVIDVVVLERDDIAGPEPGAAAEQDCDVGARIDHPAGFDETFVLYEIAD